MNNFIFKSANRLTKNSSISTGDYRLNAILKQIGFVLTEQRMQRSDLKDVNLKLEKLLIDKHLQMQVDEYFTKDDSNNIPDSGELE